jgi:hypothetical protein
MLRAATLATLVLCTACISSNTTSSFTTDRGACNTRPDLAGEWRNTRSSQLGRATMTITLGCDCRYTTRVSLLFGRIHESGEYRIEGDRIVFSRSTTAQEWPFVLDGETLTLTEAANERHVYKRYAAACN